MRIVGFDLETGSADHLYRWHEPEPYLVLGGTVENGETHVTCDFQDIIDRLYEADVIYGHNILGFDIPALVVHAGADWDALAPKAVDTLVTARHHTPPAPKGSPPVLYSLDATAQRLGVAGKTDSVQDLADSTLKNIISLHTAGLDKGEAKNVKRTVTERYRDIGTFHLIPEDDPDLRAYLEGDLLASEQIYLKLEHLLNDSYVQRELEVQRTLQYMVHAAWRVDRSRLSEAMRAEAADFSQALAELAKLAPGVPMDAAAPLRTTRGQAAFEQALLNSGVLPSDLPRTEKTGKVCTSRDALSAGDWVTSEVRTGKRWYSRSRRTWEKSLRKVKVRKPGLRQRYPHHEQVQRLCELATVVSAPDRKMPELDALADDQGVFHSSIGSMQVTGRFAMTRPSVTNIGKRGKGLEQRALFLPRNDGEVLLCADLDQCDMRVVAALCQDPEYMKLFEPGRDAHMETAFLVFHERTKTARTKAKAIGHAANYGASEATVVATSGQSARDVATYFQVRRETYPLLTRWQEEVRAEAETGLIKDNGWGRPMRCDRPSAHTQGPALYGQSGTREILMGGILRMPHTVRKMLVAVVHDEVVLSVPRGEFDEISGVVKEALTCRWRDVDFTCGTSRPGENWRECYD